MVDADAATGQWGHPTRQVGRYGIFHKIAAGGMASIHLARLAGPVGFARVVAVKHLHPHLSADPLFRSMLIDEARLAVRVRHPNVVPILDVVVSDAELFLVMEYVQGEALSQLHRAAREQNQPIPPAIAAAIMIGALQGLHAAHEARGENGDPLNLVHRDVSPPNILVGVDGVPMVLDFGVAKAAQNIQCSRPGMLKGKSAYMAPEQIRGEPVARTTDIFAAAVVMWELLTGERLFSGTTEHERMQRVLQGTDVRPSALAAQVPGGLDDVVMRGLRPSATERFQTALEMAEAIEQVSAPASQRAVGEWVARTAVDTLARRAEALKEVEASGALVPVMARPRPVTVDVDVVDVDVEIEETLRPPGAARRRALGAGVAAVGMAAVAGLVLAGRAALRRAPASRAPAARPHAPPTRFEPPVMPARLPAPPREAAPAGLPAAAAPGAARPPRPRVLERAAPAAAVAAPEITPAVASPPPAPTPAPTPAPAPATVKPRMRLVDEPERLKILD